MANLNLDVFGFSAAQLERVQDAAAQSARFRASLGGYAAAAAASADNPAAVATLRDIVLESIPAQPSRKRKAQSAAQSAAVVSQPAASMLQSQPAAVPMAEQLLAMLASMLQSQPAAVVSQPAAQPAKRVETIVVNAKRAPLDPKGYPLPWVLSASRNPDNETYYRIGTRGRSYQSCSMRHDSLMLLLDGCEGLPFDLPIQQLRCECARLYCELDRLCA